MEELIKTVYEYPFSSIFTFFILYVLLKILTKIVEIIYSFKNED